MALDAHAPTIDDRRYDELMAEVRTRIARYTPEWTPVWSDLNDNDPGITMVQVFAWLADMLTYRMNKVPELNYLKFLQLLGIELQAAQPAQTEITFPVMPAHPESSIIIPPRTQVSAEPPDGGAPVVFETERSLVALRARLAAVLACDDFAYTLVTSANESATLGFEPFGPQAREDSALLLGFADTGELPSVVIDLTFWTMPYALKSTGYQCGLPVAPGYGPDRLRWEFWNGTGWQPLEFLKDDTRALTRSGHIFLKKPAAARMARLRIDPEPTDLYWIRGRVQYSQYERPPRLLAVRTNTVAAQQAETVRDEVLGGSSGRRNQVLRLGQTPVLRGTLRLEVDEGDDKKVWTEKDDLFGSSATDQDYVLNRTSGEIRFGDGIYGAIPVGNASNPEASIVALEYRFGGGKRGNLPARAIKTPLAPVAGVQEDGVMNLLPSQGGREEESIEAARQRAPRAIKSRSRAVTAEDFEFLAMQVGMVRRAKALPLFHPEFPDVKEVPGVITVIVVPDSEGTNPIPSEDTLRSVCTYLDQRRLLTSEVYVIPPAYQQVQIEAEVIAHDNADLAEVKESIETALLTYLHPLKGGEDCQGWPFGGTIYYSRVYQQVFTIPDVHSIRRLTILLDGEQTAECQDVILKRNALVYSQDHDVTVQYQFEVEEAI